EPTLALRAKTAAAFDRDGAKARLDRSFMPVRHSLELGAANRTGRRNVIGFLLRRFLGDGSLQFARLVRDLFFDVTQVVVARVDTPVKTCRQGCSPVLNRPSKRLVTAAGRNRWHTAVEHPLLLSLTVQDCRSKIEMRPFFCRLRQSSCTRWFGQARMAG